MKIAILFVFVFLIGAVSASTLDIQNQTGRVSVTCLILDEEVLVEISLTDGDDFVLPEEYSSFERSEDRVSFVSSDFLRKDGEWIFVFPVVVNSSYDLRVHLPEGFVLKDGLVYPRGYEISSDGRNIILSWEEVFDEVIIFYEGTGNSYAWILFVIFALILLVLGLGFSKFQKKKFLSELERLKKDAKNKGKISQETLALKNLFGEEKRIVEFLMKNKSCWMKELVNELGISKVMATRKVRSLVEKGIVKKENFGKENRLRLNKI
jgi:uncharacterized membrane protein